MSGFNAIKSSEGIKVIVAQSDTDAVQVVADDNLQEYITTEVEDNVLKIYRNKKRRKLVSKNIEVHVNIKDVAMLKASSGSHIETRNQLVSENLQIKASSGADIWLATKSKNVECSASSGAMVKIKGQSSTLDLSSSSGGRIIARDLNTASCMVKVSSGADIDINVTDEIIAEASSGGHVKVTGNPKSRNIHKSSGGNVDFR